MPVYSSARPGGAADGKRGARADRRVPGRHLAG